MKYQYIFNLNIRFRLLMEWNNSFLRGGIVFWLGQKCIQVEDCRCHQNWGRMRYLISHCRQCRSHDQNQMLAHIDTYGTSHSHHSHFSAVPWMVSGYLYCVEKTKMILEQIWRNQRYLLKNNTFYVNTWLPPMTQLNNEIFRCEDFRLFCIHQAARMRREYGRTKADKAIRFLEYL